MDFYFAYETCDSMADETLISSILMAFLDLLIESFWTIFNLRSTLCQSHHMNRWIFHIRALSVSVDFVVASRRLKSDDKEPKLAFHLSNNL